jgi:hypothetical protein
MNRFQTAIAIQDACNPSGVAHSLLQAMTEARAEGQFTLTEDPAVWLIVQKLASLFPGVASYNVDPFSTHWQACVEAAHPKEPDYVEDIENTNGNTSGNIDQCRDYPATVHLG